MIIDSATLVGQQLMLRRIGEDDYSVRIGDRTVGRIRAKPAAGGGVVWLWTVTGPHFVGRYRNVSETSC